MSSSELASVFVVSLCLLTSGIVLSYGAGAESGGVREEGHFRSRRQQANTANVVELLVVLDKKAYDKFLTANGNNPILARAEIERYVAGLVKEANERFANLDTGGFSVRVSLGSIVTFTTVAESSATETNRVGNDLNADLALLAFTPQAQALEPTNRHDYAVLLTGYDVKRGTDNSDADVRTYYGGICTNLKQGIVENFCVERTALALTKGIALSMTANTDGTGNACTDNFYTLAHDFAVPPRSSQPNPWTFSACSGPEIRSYLSSPATQCLRTTEVPNPLDLAALTSMELGQQYDADMQCSRRFGPGAILCRAQYGVSSAFTYDLDLCRDMLCLMPGTNTCQGTLPFDGTTCGNQKWCQDGVCTYNASAPTTVSPTCPQGDQPGVPCSPALCSAATETFRNFTCCATCGVVTTSSATPSIAVATPTPGAVSVAGQGPATAAPVSMAGPVPTVSMAAGNPINGRLPG